MPRLLRILAKHSGQLVNYSGIGAAIGMNHVTTQKYVGIFIAASSSIFIAAPIQLVLGDWRSRRKTRLDEVAAKEQAA